MSWLLTDKEVKQQLNPSKSTGSKQDTIQRFWLQKESSTNIIFLDSKPKTIYEHNPHLEGSWKNWATCPRENCPLCDIGDRPYIVGAYPIIDKSQFVDRQGGVHTNKFKLFMAKSKVLSTLAVLDDQLKTTKADGLKFFELRVTRTGGKSSTTGDVFLPIEYKKDFVDEWLKTATVANLTNLLEPKIDLLKRLASTLYEYKSLDSDLNNDLLSDDSDKVSDVLF